MKMVDDNVGNQGLSVVSEIANQYGNENVETTPAKGNGNGINGISIRCYNCQGKGHYASNCTIKPRKRDAAYLQQQLKIYLEEESGIQSTQEEFEFITVAVAYEETERVKVNCTSEDTLQQASTSGTQYDNAPVYESDGSTEVPKDENCYDHDIFNMFTHEVQYTDLQTELDRTKEKLENCIIKKKKEYVVLRNNWFLKKGISKGTRMNTKFTKQSILGKPPSFSFKPKLYSVTPFPKSSILPKVDKTNDLSKPVTSNSAPSTRESKVVQTVNVIAPRIFRTNPSKTSRNWKVYSVICSTNYSNGENQVVSKSFAVTTADASDKRQQQQDSTSSTLTLATTITADENFDL
nr:hypothetical protein [Tanacetum cinerariifolium]